MSVKINSEAEENALAFKWAQNTDLTSNESIEAGWKSLMGDIENGEFGDYDFEDTMDLPDMKTDADIKFERDQNAIFPVLNGAMWGMHHHATVEPSEEPDEFVAPPIKDENAEEVNHSFRSNMRNDELMSAFNLATYSRMYSTEDDMTSSHNLMTPREGMFEDDEQPPRKKTRTSSSSKKECHGIDNEYVLMEMRLAQLNPRWNALNMGRSFTMATSNKDIRIMNELNDTVKRGKKQASIIEKKRRNSIKYYIYLILRMIPMPANIMQMRQIGTMHMLLSVVVQWFLVCQRMARRYPEMESLFIGPNRDGKPCPSMASIMLHNGYARKPDTPISSLVCLKDDVDETMKSVYASAKEL